MLFSACGTDDSSEQSPADQDTQTQTAQADPSPTETTEDTQTPDATDDTQSAGDGEVFDVIDAVEAEYDGGFIVDIDRDDNGSSYDVDVVVDNEVVELDVTPDGNISVDERDSEDDKIAKAERATVTVTDALNEAFNQHSDATLDQIDLDEDDGTLRWEVELDGADGSDIELEVPAT
ncbi:PepSY domain-containing protein [Enteractinococcus coprophilus]|nr:PepSY domain-containing protein [Enteractinococcus coprophilus]